MIKQRSGYILIVTLVIISMGVMLVTFMATRGLTFFPYVRIMRDREKATMLCMGGVDVAMSQLAVSAEEQKKPQEPAAKAQAESLKTKDARALLTTLLPVLNRWQEFKFNAARDGFQGKLRICVMSEAGKLNINELYDFEKQKFIGEAQPKGDMKKIAQQLCERIEKITGTKELFKGFEKFLKDRQYRVNDATQLLTIKEWAAAFNNNVWYQPPEQTKDTTKKEQRPVYLTDIFTVWPDSAQIEPWLLSDSWRALLDLNRVGAEDKEASSRTKEMLKNFKEQGNWATDWNRTFGSLYGKDFSKLPQGSDALLSARFGARFFSVLSYATIGSITQKMMAIIERREPSSKEDGARYELIIKKLYWL